MLEKMTKVENQAEKKGEGAEEGRKQKKFSNKIFPEFCLFNFVYTLFEIGV